VLAAGAYDRPPMQLRLPHLSPRTYRRITLLAAVLLAVIIVSGGAVRLTDSGLGCPEWPTCDGRSLVKYDTSDGHATIEYLNRLFTGLVSVAVIACVLGSLRRQPRRRDLVRLSCGLVAGVIGQAVLGGFVVIFDLQPPLVMAHFLLSLVLLTNAIVLYRRAGESETPSRSLVSSEVRGAGRLLLVVTAAVVVAGTFVTATGPHLGDPKVKPLSFSPPEVARVHGSLVIALLVLTGVTFLLLRRQSAPRAVQLRLALFLGVVLVQGAIGYIQYFNNIPAVLVGFHIAGATAVWSAALWYFLGLSNREPATAAAASPQPALATA
jgi:heme a synthase